MTRTEVRESVSTARPSRCSTWAPPARAGSSGSDRPRRPSECPGQNQRRAAAPRGRGRAGEVVRGAVSFRYRTGPDRPGHERILMGQSREQDDKDDLVPDPPEFSDVRRSIRNTGSCRTIAERPRYGQDFRAYEVEPPQL